MSFNSYCRNWTIHHTRAFSTHGRSKQLSSMV